MSEANRDKPDHNAPIDTIGPAGMGGGVFCATGPEWRVLRAHWEGLRIEEMASRNVARTREATESKAEWEVENRASGERWIRIMDAAQILDS